MDHDIPTLLLRRMVLLETPSSDWKTSKPDDVDEASNYISLLLALRTSTPTIFLPHIQHIYALLCFVANKAVNLTF